MTHLNNIEKLSLENQERMHRFLTEVEPITKGVKLKKMISYFLASLTDESLSLKPVIEYLISGEMTGKMQGFHSLSTSALENHFCSAYRLNPENICHFCYSVQELLRYKSLRLKMHFSTIVLTEVCLKDEDIPIIHYKDFRLEAFADLNNTIQVYNYFKFITLNSSTDTTLFTKNPFLIKKAMEEYDIQKPENMIIVFSIKLLNAKLTAEMIKSIFKMYPFIDRLFIVVTSEGIRKEYLIDKRCFPCQLHCEGCPQSCYCASACEEYPITIELLKQANKKRG